MRQRLPLWLKKRAASPEAVHSVKVGLRQKGLHTVCEEAKCPNIGECFERGTATIMIMGDVCTRRCGFCAVKGGVPLPLHAGEPRRVAMQVSELGLKHAVITSVTRDDIPDGGAAHFAATIRAVRELCPQTTVEILTPDFEGRDTDVKTVCDAAPDVFNHNVETVERLTPAVREKADYRRSLAVLSAARKYLPNGFVKSGIMAGLGETMGEVRGTLKDMRAAGCDIVTIGQYLAPSKDSLPVAEYIEPDRFAELESFALGLGFKKAFCGPLVRSSYMADKIAPPL